MDEMKEIAPDDLVKTSTKLSYGLTSLGTQFVDGVFKVSLLFYYREQLLLSEGYIILAFMLFAIWNAVNDPLFGWLSDKTKTRWGRRIPYLAIFTPVMSISFVLLWTSPSIEVIGELGVFIWLLVTMCLYDTAFTAALLVWSALGQELSMDHRVRASIQIYSLGFGVSGFLVALLLPMLFLETAGREGFIFLSIILAIVQFATMMITTVNVKERLEFSHDEPLGIIDSFKHTLKSKAFITTALMNFILIYTQSTFFGNLFFFTSYAIPGYDSFLLLMGVVIMSLAGIFVGTAYIVRINAKKGVKTAMMRSVFSQAIGFLLTGILPGIFSLIGFFFVGIGLYGAMTLFNAAYGEVADEDELKTGTRREAAIMGINALITKPAESVANALIAFFLFLFLYQEPIGGIQQSQSELTILGIRIAMGILPGLSLLLALLIFHFYPLHGQYLKEIKTKMYQVHEEKREKYLAKISKKPKD